MLSIQIQTQNFIIIKTKNQINNLPSKIGMGMGVVMREREKEESASSLGSRRRGVDGWAQPRRRRRWAGLGSALRRRRGCVCVRACVNVRGRVRDREKMREYCE